MAVHQLAQKIKNAYISQYKTFRKKKIHLANR